MSVSEEGKIEFKKKVMGANGAKERKSLVEIQKQIKGAASSKARESLGKERKTY